MCLYAHLAVSVLATAQAADADGVGVGKVWQLFPTEGGKVVPSVVFKQQGDQAKLVTVKYSNRGSTVEQFAFPFADGQGQTEGCALEFDGSKGSLTIGDTAVPVEGIALPVTAQPKKFSLFVEKLDVVERGQSAGQAISVLLIGDIASVSGLIAGDDDT